MSADAAGAIADWIAGAVVGQEKRPVLDRQALRGALEGAIGQIVGRAAAPGDCARAIVACFGGAAGHRLTQSGAVADQLREAVAGLVADAVRADGVAWAGADGSGGDWVAGQIAGAAVVALYRVTIASVVSYLQARGFVTFVYGYYKAQYQAALHGARAGGLASFLTGIRILAANLRAVGGHVFVVIGKSLWHALTKTTLDALRTAPAMLAVIIFLFLTSDAWHIFGSEAIWRVITLLALLLVVSLAFFFLGSPAQDGPLSEVLPAGKDMQALTAPTPAWLWAQSGLEPAPAPLRRGQQLNVAGIYAGLMAGNFLAVGLLTAFALTAFGVLAFDAPVQQHLIGTTRADFIFRWGIAGHQLALSWQLVIVSLILSGIAVLSLAVSLQAKGARASFCGANIADLQGCLSAYWYWQAAEAWLTAREQLTTPDAAGLAGSHGSLPADPAR
jgi:hypothetical protein